MPVPSHARRSRSAHMLSTVLFIVAIGFAAAAVWFWYTDDAHPGPGTPTPAQNAEEIDLAQVLRVLKQRDSGWDYSRSPASARSNQLAMPGQALKRGDQLLFVFIFTGASADDRVAARERAAEQVDLGTMTLSTTSGKVLNAGGEPLHMAQHSNVIAILLGGDDALAGEVQAALDDLP